MPESAWHQHLASAAGEVLETMFFTAVYGAIPEVQDEDPPPFCARVGFAGQPSGTLALSISAPSARTLAGNFLASEDPGALASAQIGSVVCELANMICGSLLSRVEKETHFRLAAPELRVTAMPPEGAQAYDLGDGVLRLSLALEEHAER